MQSNLAKVSPHTQMGHEGRFVQWYYYLQVAIDPRKKKLLLAKSTGIKSKAHNSQQEQNKDT